MTEGCWDVILSDKGKANKLGILGLSFNTILSGETYVARESPHI
jgi:hypothetical protein